MIDPRALPRLLDELVWVLRRQGFSVAPSQVLDLVRGIRAVGWEDRGAVLEVTASIVLSRAADRPRLDQAFTSFFAREKAPTDLWGRLLGRGFTPDELGALRELFDAMAVGATASAGDSERLGALLEGGAELDRLLQLAGVRRELELLQSPLQVGFAAQRAANVLGLSRARERLAQLRQHLRGALGARGDLLADALGAELDRTGQALREHVQSATLRLRDARRGEAGARRRDEIPFAQLSAAELEDVRRAVRAFADRLRGAERVRARRARRGRLDPGRTMRTLARTGGVPFKPARRRRRSDRPRLLLLCDVSESVRAASRFMLELVHAAHEIFERTRSFVFVSELGETTALFEREAASAALAAAYGGEVVPVTDNSNYGRVLRAFEARHLAAVDRRTTVVILGDGRTNYHDASPETLARIGARARALYWLCSEPRAGWASGDSAMPRYAPHCTAVFEVTTARELEAAARTIAQSR